MNYKLLALVLLVLLLTLYALTITSKRIRTGRMIVIVIMTALSVIGRFIPFFKPIAALSIITGMYVNAGSGMMVGMLSVLISNFYFGQGPWTPFQMLAFGLIGFLSGVLSKYLINNKTFLISYSLLCGVAYSLILDVWTVLWLGGGNLLEKYLATAVTAIPFTLVYAISNVIYILILNKPFGEKLLRMKVKYGI
mgnify:CR=1 FL=1